MSKAVSAGVKTNQSSEKLLKMIEYLAGQREPKRLLDISRELGINSSTALRFLTALVENGYASQDAESSRYYLTCKICGLANQVLQNTDIRTIARIHDGNIEHIWRNCLPGCRKGYEGCLH